MPHSSIFLLKHLQYKIPFCKTNAKKIQLYSIVKLHKKMSIMNSYKRFSADEDFPDLSIHNNHMSQCLTNEIYAKLRTLQTPNGFTLDKAIQTGVDNPGKLKNLISVFLTHVRFGAKFWAVGTLKQFRKPVPPLSLSLGLTLDLSRV